MKKFADKYLTGKCLISNSYVENDIFSNSLVYICSHTKDGAIGFIINKKLPEHLSKSFNEEMNAQNRINIYQGGPIEEIKGFIIHSTDYLSYDTIEIDSQTAISSSMDVLRDITMGEGPQKSLLLMGYTSWQAEQLENEIRKNDWLVIDSSPEIIFNQDDRMKWHDAIKTLGFDMSQLSPLSGTA
ncbi:MAG: YqgE/AlgH family protein [Alphaproteobacteria bacterium]|nr:YqgE/AlgH family protein [Alphaproteobacteria bacterium]